MALHLHRADRTDLLAGGLGALLANPLPDPFAEELVLVSARGMERWLSQRLSHVLGRGDGADGVCAGVAFRSPASLIAEITGTVDDDPWSPDAMTWPLLDAIDASCDEDWCRTLATHLGHFDTGDEAELRRGRRYAVARRLAGLFASYAEQRPQIARRLARRQAHRRRRQQPRPGPAVAAPPVARTRRPHRGRPAPRPSRQDPRPAARGPERTARAALAVRPYPAAIHRHRTARGAVHPPRTAPVAAAPEQRRCGRRSPTSTSPCRARTTPAATGPTIRCSTPSAAICAKCSAACQRGDTDEFVGAATTTRHAAGLAAVRHLRQRGPARARDNSATTTARCRCTAATAPPARSTCSARCCWACCTTTRRSNRATSS